jgi:hypothetical protein
MISGSIVPSTRPVEGSMTLSVSVFNLALPGQVFQMDHQLSNDNYNSFSGDSYFSRLFWVNRPGFLTFSWFGFLLSLAPTFRATIVNGTCKPSFHTLGSPIGDAAFESPSIMAKLVPRRAN